MSMREEVLKLAEECGVDLHCSVIEVSAKQIGFLERFYQAAYLAGAKAMQEEAAKVCKAKSEEFYGRNSRWQHHTGAGTGADCCHEAIRAINPENLGGE